MKKYFGVLILIMTIQSCAKIEEVILLQNEDVAKEIVAKDYLPLDKTDLITLRL